MATISSPQKPQGESESPKHREPLRQRSKERAGTVIGLKRKGRDGRAKRNRRQHPDCEEQFFSVCHAVHCFSGSVA